ncbi:MAG: hypothetical protein GX907_03215 [Clostridiaceae bacterium]|nr:hypothetical protein [Clostridiaceae bacterium]
MKDKRKKKIISIVAAVTVLLVGMFTLMGSSLAAEANTRRARGANPDCPVVNGEAEPGDGLKLRQGNSAENRRRDGSGCGEAGSGEGQKLRQGNAEENRKRDGSGLGAGQGEGGNGARRNAGENRGSEAGKGVGRNSEAAEQRRAENRANCNCEQPGTCDPRGSQQRGKDA